MRKSKPESQEQEIGGGGRLGAPEPEAPEPEASEPDQTVNEEDGS